MPVQTAAAVPRAHDMQSSRLRALKPFLFDEIDRLKRERIAAGADVINLGVGDPDQPTPDFIVDAMNVAMRETVNHQYPAVGGGLAVFRQSAARFMERRFGVKVDPQKHIVCCIGSKDGIAHLPWAITDPGDVVLAPTPAYPVYEIGATLAGCVVHQTPLLERAGWTADLSAVPTDSRDRARILWLNYPSNPTSASATPDVFDDALRFAEPTWTQGRGCVVASDLAYSELYVEHPPRSLWQSPLASIEHTRAIEFHSLSKTFNMAGWRIGFAVGHADVIAALARLKSNVDSGVFNAIQIAGAVALDHFDDAQVARLRRTYQQRRDLIVPALRAAGCEVRVPDAGFFVWAGVPSRYQKPGGSAEFAAWLLTHHDLVVVPGSGFGPGGEGFVRIALTVETDRIAAAAARLKRSS